MTLNLNGAISLAGSTTGQSIALELGRSTTGVISLNDSDVRALGGKSSGSITMPTDFWAKSGSIWTAVSSNNRSYSDIIWDGSRFVAIDVLGELGTSSDGQTWSAAVDNLPAGAEVNGLAYSGSIYVAVGRDGSNNVTSAYTSPDTTSWTKRVITGYGRDLYKVVYGNSRFVAVGNYGLIATSTTGTTWTVVASADNDIGITANLPYPILDIAWSGSVFAAVGESGLIYYSTNGTTWFDSDTRIDSTINFKSITWGLNKFVAVGIDTVTNNGAIFTSTDGSIWTRQTSFSTLTGAAGFTAVGATNSKFVAGGQAGQIRISTDGITWSSSNINSSIYITDAIASKFGRAVLVGSSIYYADP